MRDQDDWNGRRDFGLPVLIIAMVVLVGALAGGADLFNY